MTNVAFIKNNLVMDILVFDDTQNNEELIAKIVTDNNYDTSININNDPVGRYSTWNGIEFVETAPEVLNDLGVRSYVPIPEEESSN